MSVRTLVALTLLALTGTSALASDPAAPAAIERDGDVVSIFSGDVHIPANVIQHGTVICIGGDAVIEGTVTEDVVVILGSLELRGSVGRAVTGVMADQTLDGADVGHDLVNVLGSLELRNSNVSREMVNVLGSLRLDRSSTNIGHVVNIGFGSWFPDFWWLLFWLRLFHKLLVFVLVLLLVALVPERIALIGEVAPVRYVAAFFVGVAGYLGALIAVGLLAATVIGLPLAMLAFYTLKWMGIAGIFLAVGRRLGRSFRWELSVPGAVLLSFALYVALMLAPAPLGFVGLLLSLVLGTLFFLLVELPALGLVILTRAGSRGSPALVSPLPAVVAAPPGPPTPGSGMTGPTSAV